MKWGWVLVLLVSLGLNLGLGIRLLGDREPSSGRREASRGGDVRRSGHRWAEQDSFAREQMFDRRLDRIAEALELAPGQREVFREVHLKTGRLLMRKRVLISEKRDQLQALVTGDGIDQERIRGVIADLGQEQAILDSLVAETMLQEMEVLDPGQRERYLEMLSFGKGGPGHRRGSGGRGTPRQ
jgi:Spy/CpxP family protein refolding chaperone